MNELDLGGLEFTEDDFNSEGPRTTAAIANDLLRERLSKAHKVTFRKGSLITPVECWPSLPFAARLVCIEKLKGDEG